MKLGEPLPKRTKLLKELQQDKKTTGTHSVPFKGEQLHLPIHRVSIDFPKYRLINSRTLAAQDDYLATHPDAPRDLFKKDHESEVAQKIQHDLLKELMYDEKLYDYFTKNKQTEPLILTSLGFIVNGNRRLCAMRELYAKDSVKYKHFEHIAVVVLPAAEDEDLYQLEADLQSKPDIKAEYGWIEKGKMLRLGREAHNFSDAKLQKIHDMKPSELKRTFALLEAAEAYLKERGRDGQYHLIERKEFAFKKLLDARAKLHDEGKKEVFRRVAYRLIDDPNPEGRLYESIPDVAENIGRVIAKLRDEVPLAKVKAGAGHSLLGGKHAELVPLVKAIDKEENREKVLAVVQDVIQSENAKAKMKRDADYAVNQVKKANSLLAEAFTTLDPKKSTTDGISDQLESIDASVKKIRAWLKKHT